MLLCWVCKYLQMLYPFLRLTTLLLCNALSLLIVFILKSIFFNMSIDIPDFFLFWFAWNIFYIPSLWVCVFILIWSECFLDITFKVIIAKYVLISVLLIIFWLFCCSLFFFFLLVSSVMIYWISLVLYMFDVLLHHHLGFLFNMIHFKH